MMHFTTKIAAAVTALALSAGSAMAWGDIYMGDGTPITNPPVYAYPGVENNCPSGLRPVVVGGEICCGRPTAAGYGDYTPMPRAKKKVYKARRTVRSAPAPRAYAPEGVKGVVYE